LYFYYAGWRRVAKPCSVPEAQRKGVDPDAVQEKKEDRDRKTNQAEQKDEFDAAIQEINRRLGGHELDNGEIQTLHEELHHDEPQDYWGIIKI
jgi:hypothetical protein